MEDIFSNPEAFKGQWRNSFFNGNDIRNIVYDEDTQTFRLAIRFRLTDEWRYISPPGVNMTRILEPSHSAMAIDENHNLWGYTVRIPGPYITDTTPPLGLENAYSTRIVEGDWARGDNYRIMAPNVKQATLASRSLLILETDGTLKVYGGTHVRRVYSFSRTQLPHTIGGCRVSTSESEECFPQLVEMHIPGFPADSFKHEGWETVDSSGAMDFSYCNMTYIWFYRRSRFNVFDTFGFQTIATGVEGFSVSNFGTNLLIRKV